MYRTYIDFHNRIQRGEKPTTYVLITTDMGSRAYGDKELTEVFDTGTYLADGSYTAGGSITAGPGLGLMEKAGRLKSSSAFERTIQPRTRDVIGSLDQRQLQQVTVILDNRDRHFSQLLPAEPFLGKTLAVYVGFEAAPFAQHIKLFEGTISEVSPGPDLILEADEQSTLDGYFRLSRAGRYAAPLNTNDRLPLVYGDLTDGSAGNWTLPCIDTVNFVYCFSGFAVQTVVQGNSINIYADGVLVDPANYTFNASNDYEGQGAIATITFVSDQANAQITARGKGKAVAGVLMENIIDIIEDFLTVQMDYSSSIFESTAKARSEAIFVAQAYQAAGVIHEDAPKWEILQRMIGSFYGMAYYDGSGLLVLEIDDGTLSQYGNAGIIPKSDVRLVGPPMQRKANLINQLPASYSYNYVSGDDFRNHDGGGGSADAISQDIWGTQEPLSPYRFYWCRHLASVQAIQDLVVTRYRYPLWEIEVEDLSLKRAHVDVGDIVALTVDWLYDKEGDPLHNELWKVIGVKPNFSKGRQTLRALDTGYFLTTAGLADGTYEAGGEIKAGGDRDTLEY